jgi:cysteine-rich repeat protein
VINPGEQCDDGNKVNGDGCDNNCTFTSCGNGMLTTGEVCDDGNLMSGDGCDSNCKPTGCGNGIVTAPEGCDDGNLVSGDGCDSNCRPTGCGNGVVTPPEQCDDGNFVNGDGCDNDCKAPVCGDGVVRAPEQCDDHNLIDGDGCDHNCRLTGCGNGVVSTPEACDDGNMIDGDGCEHNCTLTACGPGGVGTIPGYCGSRANDCEAEFCVPGFPQISAKSLPTNILRCKEGDPSCDATSGDGVCTFRFALCYNVDDHRIPCAKTGRIERVSFRRPSESAPRGRYNIANRDAIEAALVAIGGVVKGKCHNGGPKKGTVCGNDAACDNPTGSGNGVCVSRQVMFSPLLTTPNVCTPLLSFKVPLRVVHSGVASGRTDVRIRAYGPKPDKKDGDILKFFCLP